MLAVFDRSVGNPPEELSISAGWMVPSNRSEMADLFSSERPGGTFYKFSNGNFMALSQPDENNPVRPRSIAVMEDVFCIFSGNIENISELRIHHSLQPVTEATLVVEFYKRHRDQAPHPLDQLIKNVVGKFALVLFDAKSSTIFAARDRDGGVKFHWGMAEDESLVFTDDSEVILDVCGRSCAPFPAGCIFMNKSGLVSFDHPLHKVKAVTHTDEDGQVCGVFFHVDHSTRRRRVQRLGHATIWNNASAM